MLIFVAIISVLCSILRHPVVADDGKNFIDPSCALKISPPRDAVQNSKVYLRGLEQHCKIYLTGGAVATYSYVLNQNGIPIINTAATVLTSVNLETGSGPTISSRAYAILMGGQDALPGQIIGAILGGRGDQMANIFPQSSANSLEWASIESNVYNCLSQQTSNEVTLSWRFTYHNSAGTMPISILYSAIFEGGPHPCPNIRRNLRN